MKNKMDLTNQRFGRLTVIGENLEPYRSNSGSKMRRWDCLCDCGKQVTVPQGSLTTGNTKSCGCLSREKAASRHKDLKGKRFGKLVVVKRVPLDKSRAGECQNGWLCKCDCGKETVVCTEALTNGHKKSCGCYALESASELIRADGRNIFGRYKGTVIAQIKLGRKPSKCNRSGVIGVHWDERKQRWAARIGFQGKKIFLGYFKDIKEAEKTRKEAEEKYYIPILEQWKEEQNKKNEEDLAC